MEFFTSHHPFVYLTGYRKQFLEGRVDVGLQGGKVPPEVGDRQPPKRHVRYRPHRQHLVYLKIHRIVPWKTEFVQRFIFQQDPSSRQECEIQHIIITCQLRSNLLNCSPAGVLWIDSISCNDLGRLCMICHWWWHNQKLSILSTATLSKKWIDRFKQTIRQYVKNLNFSPD